ILVGLLLLYVTFAPFISKSRKEKRIIPHGDAKVLGIAEVTSYKKVAVTVDFSEHDRETIWNALNQGGKEAEYRLIHIVESAVARYSQEYSDDTETRLDKENLLLYQEELMKQGYVVSSEMGFGNPVSA